MSNRLYHMVLRPFCSLLLLAISISSAWSADVYLRARVLTPIQGSFHLSAGGHIHQDPWGLPGMTQDAKAGEWSPWFDLTTWNLHGKVDLVGGVAEWPCLTLAITNTDNTPINGCEMQVQMADKPDATAVVIDFTEKSGSNTIAFLCPHPLREHKDEFETGSQMTARQLAWAKAAAGNRMPNLKQFQVITSVWGHYDPILADQATLTLKYLGVNVIGGVPVSVMQKNGMKTYTATWHMMPDPDVSKETWWKGEGAGIKAALSKPGDGKWTYENMAHYVICDEVQTLVFDGVDTQKLNGWFHEYLRAKGETDASMGKAIDGIEYPVKEVRARTLPRDADLTTRKIMYYAGKFGQYWSVKALRQSTDLVHETFKSLPNGMRTETLPSDHHFFNAWGAPSCGMDAGGLDFFEIGHQRAVDIISTEDWLGLNHMYGAYYTWTGGWAFGYLAAIYRSGIGDNPVALRALITPSDEGYLRLKAYSGLGQGAKSIFYWTFGPTFLGTENYWSDQRSEYDGIAKVTRALEKSESVLFPAKPVRDKVALMYSVSHDLWHTDDPACLVENRLTWTALRQLGVQPDLLREEDVEAGKLQNYQVLYINAQCLTRKASAQIDAWVKNGGTAYLSAGAATRDEFYSPYLPGFAAAVWPGDAANQIVKETGHAYNERGDLPGIKPMASAKVNIAGQFDMKVIGYRLNLRDNVQGTLATFDDGKTAGARVPYGKGMVMAVGFLPGLAYSPFKAGQATLDEKWAPEPRRLFALPLAALKSRAITLSVPVVEGSLLTGQQGSAVVLANYTYQPITSLKITLNPSIKAKTAVSTEGVPVKMQRTKAGLVLTLPLQWTDIIVMK